MTRIKYLQLLIVLLIVLNAGVLLFVFFAGRPSDPRGGHREPREIIIERLNFDDDQVEAYQQLIDWHRSHIREQEEILLAAKKELYGSIARADSTHRDSLFQVIAGTHATIEQIHFRHFEDIHRVCRPDQQAAFQELARDLGRLFDRPKPPRRRD